MAGRLIGNQPLCTMKSFFSCLLALIAFTAAAQNGDFHLDKEFNIRNGGTIDLATSDGKVFITGSKRTNVHVKIDRNVTVKGWGSSSEDFRVDVEETSGDLRIRERQSRTEIAIGYYKEEYRVEIEAPEGVSLTIRGDDGDYYIKNINGSISASTDDADVELSGCKGDRFSFRLDDGDLRMDSGKGSLDIDIDDADVNIRNGQFTSIHAESDDGDLIIETSLSNQGEYMFRSQDGLVSLNITAGGGDFDIHHDDGHVQTQGDFKLTYESENRTRLSLANGSAKVTVRGDDARVRLAAN
jgi:hypothetical protein